MCPGRETERLSPVSCGHAPFTCKSVCKPKVAIEQVPPDVMPAEVKRHLRRFNATGIPAEQATLRAHGRVLHLFAAAGDGILPRLANEFSDPTRYRTDRLSVGQGVVVDIGCNIGDFSISAWKQNPRLHILCLEPMPVTYAFLIWNLLANGVPHLAPNAFGVAGAAGGVLPLRAAVTADGRYYAQIANRWDECYQRLTDEFSSTEGINSTHIGM